MWSKYKGHSIKRELKKIISILQKYLFEAIQNGFSIEQRSVIKCSVAEMSKPYENYRMICDIYKEVCSSQIVFRNELNTGFSLWVCVKKAVHGMETYNPIKKKKSVYNN